MGRKERAAACSPAALLLPPGATSGAAEGVRAARRAGSDLQLKEHPERTSRGESERERRGRREREGDDKKNATGQQQREKIGEGSDLKGGADI